MDVNVLKLKRLFELELGEKVLFEIDKESNPVTISFENNYFVISIWSNGDELVIGNIDSFKDGYGKKIIDILKEFCGEEGFNSMMA